MKVEQRDQGTERAPYAPGKVDLMYLLGSQVGASILSFAEPVLSYVAQIRELQQIYARAFQEARAKRRDRKALRRMLGLPRVVYGGRQRTVAYPIASADEIRSMDCPHLIVMSRINFN